MQVEKKRTTNVPIGDEMPYIDEIKARGLIEQLRDRSDSRRRNAAIELGELKARDAINPLAKALKDRDWVVRCAAAWALGEIGGDEAAKALQRVYKPYDKSKGGLSEEFYVSTIVGHSLKKARGGIGINLDEMDNKKRTFMESLFNDRFPSLSGPHPEVISDRLSKLQKVVNELDTELGDAFIGISLGGGYAKGYAVDESDLDMGLFVDKMKDRDVVDKIKDRLWNAGIRFDFALGVFDLASGINSFDIINASIFDSEVLGNPQKIRKAQVKMLENLENYPVRETIWTESRLSRANALITLSNLSRMGLSPDETEEVKARRLIKFALPSFEEMRRIYLGHR